MYNGYFGFLELPLALPRPAFFYPNPVHLEAYASLRHGIDAK